MGQKAPYTHQPATFSMLIKMMVIVLLVNMLSACNFPSRTAQEPLSIDALYSNLLKTLTPQPGQLLSTEPPEPTAFQPDAVTQNVSPTNETKMLFLHPGLPTSFLAGLDFNALPLTEDENLAAVKVFLSGDPAEFPESSDITWIYALAAPFYTITDEISFADLANYWRGETSSLEHFSIIYLTDPTKAAMITIFGEPDSNAVQTVPQADLLSLAANSEPILVILPFEELNPRWKVLGVEGQSPIQDDFRPKNYPLSVHIWAEGEEMITLPESNYHPDKRTTVTMTGVTALTRATAYQMETRGVNFPAQEIVDWLTASDLTHISNEVPFAANCPYPDPVQKDLIFCSNPAYMELFEFIGADVIELTGNHLLDYGIEAINLTLNMYDAQRLPAYGGGWTLSEARTPVKITHHGNQLAFLGCNLPGPYSNFAADQQPGAAACGDYEWLIEEIKRAKDEDYLPIVSIQYYEDYTSYPSPQMMIDFQRLADAGTVAVFGSQAHTPKVMAFHNDSFIHYGLGNLFFDQMEVYYNDTLMPHTREEFVDRLIFYDGRLISVELRTAMLEDYARPRPMSIVERQNFLNRIFSAANE